MNKTFRDYLTESFKKPKNAFPQSKKTYANHIKATKEGKALFEKIKAEYEDNGEKMDTGTVAIAKLNKSQKYIVVWVQNSDGSIGGVGGKFINGGHSSTTQAMLDDHTSVGYDDWEVGGNYTITWL